MTLWVVFGSQVIVVRTYLLYVRRMFHYITVPLTCFNITKRVSYLDGWRAPQALQLTLGTK